MHGSTPARDRAGGSSRRGRPRERRAPSYQVPRQRRAVEDPPAGERWWREPSQDGHGGDGYPGEAYAGDVYPGDVYAGNGYAEDGYAGWDGQPGAGQHPGWAAQPGYGYPRSGQEQPQSGWPAARAAPADGRAGRVYGRSPDPAPRVGAVSRPGGAVRASNPPGGGEFRGHPYRGGAPRDGAARAGGPPGRRGRAPRWALVSLVVGTLLSLIGGGTALAATVLMDRYAGNVQQENLLGAAAVDPAESLDGPINMLMLGLDEREAGTENTRSDTVIVLHVPSTHDQAYLISVPRDTWVTVPGYWDMKITEAFFHGNKDGGWNGGAQLVAQSLHQLTGLSFNAAAIVNFHGFEKIIDEMGNIELCVDTAATSEHLVLVNGERMGIGQARREGWAYERIRYEVGCYELAGWQALDYARQRKNLESGEGDYARQRHQQQLLQGIAAKATSTDVMTNVGMVDRLLRAAGDALIVDTNQADLASLAFTLRDVRPGDIVSLRTNEGWYNSAKISGVSAELLTEESLAMFQAAANDTMAEFIIDHPELVNAD